MAKTNGKSEKDLQVLQEIENANQSGNNQQSEINNSETKSNVPSETKSKPNMLDGYKIIPNDELPQEGVLYPESWRFAYRCPEAVEVANLSTVNENDQPGIIAVTEDLIRKCVIIYDTEKQTQISSGEINDAHRVFFLLKLREEYLPGNPLSYNSMCSVDKEKMEVLIKAKSLIYPDLTEKLLNSFDGRRFSLVYPNFEEPIIFHIPTLELSSRIFKYIIKAYKAAQADREKGDEQIIYDKQFLLLAPYMYVTGNETVKELLKKYNKIKQNEELFKIYLEIATKIKLDNYDYVYATCGVCGSEEEAQLRFPGGYKKLFIGSKDSTGYFN